MQRDIKDGPQVQMTCPYCGAQEVPAKTYLYEDWITSLFLRVIPMRSIWCQCSECSKQAIIKRMSWSEVCSTPDESYTGVVHRYQSGIVRVLAAISPVFSIIPFVGLVVAASLTLATWRAGSWPRAISLVALVLSCATTAIVAVSLVIAPAGN